MIIQAPRIDFDNKDSTSINVLGKAKGLYHTAALQLSTSSLTSSMTRRVVNGHTIHVEVRKNIIADFIFGYVKISPIFSGTLDLKSPGFYIDIAVDRLGQINTPTSSLYAKTSPLSAHFSEEYTIPILETENSLILSSAETDDPIIDPMCISTRLSDTEQQIVYSGAESYYARYFDIQDPSVGAVTIFNGVKYWTPGNAVIDVRVVGTKIYILSGWSGKDAWIGLYITDVLSYTPNRYLYLEDEVILMDIGGADDIALINTIPYQLSRGKSKCLDAKIKPDTSEVTFIINCEETGTTNTDELNDLQYITFDTNEITVPYTIDLDDGDPNFEYCLLGDVFNTQTLNQSLYEETIAEVRERVPLVTEWLKSRWFGRCGYEFTDTSGPYIDSSAELPGGESLWLLDNWDDIDESNRILHWWGANYPLSDGSSFDGVNPPDKQDLHDAVMRAYSGPELFLTSYIKTKSYYTDVEGSLYEHVYYPISESSGLTARLEQLIIHKSHFLREAVSSRRIGGSGYIVGVTYNDDTKSEDYQKKSYIRFGSTVTGTSNYTKFFDYFYAQYGSYSGFPQYPDPEAPYYNEILEWAKPLTNKFKETTDVSGNLSGYCGFFRDGVLLNKAGPYYDHDIFNGLSTLNEQIWTLEDGFNHRFTERRQTISKREPLPAYYGGHFQNQFTQEGVTYTEPAFGSNSENPGQTSYSPVDIPLEYDLKVNKGLRSVKTESLIGNTVVKGNVNQYTSETIPISDIEGFPFGVIDSPPPPLTPEKTTKVSISPIGSRPNPGFRSFDQVESFIVSTSIYKDSSDFPNTKRNWLWIEDSSRNIIKQIDIIATDSGDFNINSDDHRNSMIVCCNAHLPIIQ